ncbi:MAG: endo-1,4-beta-xylanase [Actinomycetes bacterium]
MVGPRGIRSARFALVGLAGLALLTGACRPVPPDATLRSLAALRDGRSIGTSVDPTQFSRPADAGLIGTQFSSVTPENAMKWEVVHPGTSTWNFATGDAILDFAEAHGQRVRGHALVWHRQNPAWLTGGTFTREQLTQVLRDHIETLVGRYRGRIAQWDVVNEAIADDGTLRDTLWLRGIGPDYIRLAFEYAHAADPDAELYINDYLIELGGPKADTLLWIVQSLRAAGVPIHGVGYQMHELGPAMMPNPDLLAERMRRFTAVGVDVEITEMDVALRLPSDPVADPQRQADAYGSAVMACLAVSRCTGITTWNYADSESWIPGEFPGWGEASIYDGSLAPKPAVDRIRKLLWWNLRAR